MRKIFLILIILLQISCNNDKVNTQFLIDSHFSRNENLNKNIFLYEFGYTRNIQVYIIDYYNSSSFCLNSQDSAYILKQVNGIKSNNIDKNWNWNNFNFNDNVKILSKDTFDLSIATIKEKNNSSQKKEESPQIIYKETFSRLFPNGYYSLSQPIYNQDNNLCIILEEKSLLFTREVRLLIYKKDKHWQLIDSFLCGIT